MHCSGFMFLVWASLTCVNVDNKPALVDTFCNSYTPVRWSTLDTRQTKEETDTNNRKWKARCAKKGGQ